MSAQARDPQDFVSRTFKVGDFVCEMTFTAPRDGQPFTMAMHWAPFVPSTLSREQSREYKRNRDAALRSAARQLAAMAERHCLVLDPDPCGLAAPLFH